MTGGEVRDRPVCMPVPAGMPVPAPSSAGRPVPIPLLADMPVFCTVVPKHAGPPPCHPEEAELTKDLFPVSLTGGGGKKILRFAQDDMGKVQDNRRRSPGQAGLHASARGYASSCAVVRKRDGFRVPARRQAEAGVLRRPHKRTGPPPCHPEEAEPTKDLFPVSLTGGGGKKILRFAQDDMGGGSSG